MKAVAATLAVLAVAIVVLATRGGDDRYGGTVLLKNAYGLRKGSTVRIGGVAAGKVTSLTLGDQDVVVARFELDDDAAPLGTGFETSVRAANLLGEKYLQLDGGNPARPVADGFRVQLGDVPTPVELDDVLDVLDPTTRLRLRILINELGTSLTGRQADFSALLERVPPSLDAVDRLVAEVADSNTALGDAIVRSDRFIGALDDERVQLGNVVTAADGALAGFAAKRTELGETIERAPDFVAQTTAWLKRLEQTAVPLKPAAQLITASAPGLERTLAAVPAFRAAASPTLRTAREIAPDLTRLATQAAPVLRRAVPTVRAVAQFATTLKPTTETLDIAIDDTLGVVEGWARSIQNRDGIGHVFRGRFSGGADLVKAVLSESLAPSRRGRRQRPGRPQTVAPPTSAPATPAPGRLPALKTPVLSIGGIKLPAIDVTGTVDKTTQDVTGLLDYLLKP